MSPPRFIQCDRDTLYLMPPSVQDRLPENHLARFVVDTVSQLDLWPLVSAYAGRGSDAYPPGTLLALLFYGYATVVFSSRKLEAATYDSVAFRFITANTHPDLDTIAKAKAEIQRRASERYGKEKEAYNQKMADRKVKEQENGGNCIWHHQSRYRISPIPTSRFGICQR